MAYWLPRHQDDYFIAINNAYAGTYQRRFKHRPGSSESPETVKARANAEMDDFSRRGHAAIDAYKRKKQMGRA